MKNTPCDAEDRVELPPEVYRKQLHRFLQEELTQAQREVLVAYYFQELKLSEIARYRGVNKSSVWRILKRAERRIQRFLRY